MAKPQKTKPTKQNVSHYLNALENEQQRKDCKVIAKLMEDITGVKPVLWGSSIVGYGQYHYKSEKSGLEGDWPLTSFAARKTNLTIYIMQGFEPHEELMTKLGKFKHSKSCLYIQKLADVDQAVLRELIEKSLAYMHETYETTLE